MAERKSPFFCDSFASWISSGTVLSQPARTRKSSNNRVYVAARMLNDPITMVATSERCWRKYIFALGALSESLSTQPGSFNTGSRHSYPQLLCLGGRSYMPL